MRKLKHFSRHQARSYQQKFFRVLGLQFQITTSPLCLSVKLPECKKEATVHEIKLAIELLAEGALQLQIIQSVTGQLIHALFFRRHSLTFSKLKPLFAASDERRFSALMKSKPFRALLKTTLHDMANLIARAKPLKFTAVSQCKKLALAYTDSSLEPQPDGTKTAQIGGSLFFWQARTTMSRV